ncbi:MAG: TIGR02757 family protein [Desulfobacteraceae bacterium]|nr:TIGR02757 family protein [Desulfobacteraceae bacterium]
MNVSDVPIVTKGQLDRLYASYNSPEWIHPDPLEYLYHYPRFHDREVVGLIASSLAYGKVIQILKSVSVVLEKMGPFPCEFLKLQTPSSLEQTFFDFRHRFTTGKELAQLLTGIKAVIERFGSLYACFFAGLKQDHETVLPALSFLVENLRAALDGHPNSLLPLPEKGSACKRLNLFLRWMVREDKVDPGGWRGVGPSRLIIPLDTHMHRICTLLKLTDRKSSNMRTAREITCAFSQIEPSDPVRYDFALTRLGIRNDADMGSFLNRCNNPHLGGKGS